MCSSFDANSCKDQENSAGCLEVIKDLERKAELEREKFSRLALKCKKQINFLFLTTLISSILVAFLSVADPLLLGLSSKEFLFVPLTFIGFILTFVALVGKIFNLDGKHAEYNAAEVALTGYIRDSHNYRHTKANSDNLENLIAYTNYLKGVYSTMVKSFPRISMTPAQFLKLKQIYALKKQAAKKIDRDPSADITHELKKIKELEK